MSLFLKKTEIETATPIKKTASHLNVTSPATLGHLQMSQIRQEPEKFKSPEFRPCDFFTLSIKLQLLGNLSTTRVLKASLRMTCERRYD